MPFIKKRFPSDAAALGLAALLWPVATSAQTATTPVTPGPPAPPAATAPVPKNPAPAPPVPTVTTPDKAAPMPAMPVPGMVEEGLPNAVLPMAAPPPTETLTLDETLQRAFANQDATLRYGLNQDRAVRNVNLAKTAFLPTLNTIARVNITSRREQLSSSADGVQFLGERARLGLTAAYPLYDAGLRQNNLKIAQSGLRQTQDAIEADKAVLVQTTLVAFFRVLQAQRLVDASQLQVDAARRQVSAAQTRLSLGAVTRADVLAAQSQLSSSLAQWDSRNLTLIASRASLARILGGDPTQLVPGAAAPVPSAQPVDAPDVLIARALQNSPQRDLLVSQREAARTGLSVIRAQQSPRVVLKVSGGFVDRQKTNGGDTTEPYSEVAANLTIPLLTRPSVRAQEQSQKDTIQLRDLAIRQFDRRLKEQILVASAAYQATSTQVAARTAAQTDAQEASRLAQERYAVGRGTQIEVFDALLRLSNASDQLATTLNQRDIASERLRLSVGADQALLNLIPVGSDGADTLLSTPLPNAGATGGDLTVPDAGGGGLDGTAGAGLGASGGSLDQGF